MRHLLLIRFSDLSPGHANLVEILILLFIGNRGPLRNDLVPVKGERNVASFEIAHRCVGMTPLLEPDKSIAFGLVREDVSGDLGVPDRAVLSRKIRFKLLLGHLCTEPLHDDVALNFRVVWLEGTLRQIITVAHGSGLGFHGGKIKIEIEESELVPLVLKVLQIVHRALKIGLVLKLDSARPKRLLVVFDDLDQGALQAFALEELG